MQGPVDEQDIAVLAALIKDFERDLGIELRIDEPTRLKSRLSLSSMTQVDLRALVLDEPRSGWAEPPTPRFGDRPAGEGAVEEEQTRLLIPLKRRWPNGRPPERRDDHVHLVVNKEERNPALADTAPLRVVVRASEPVPEVIVRITDSIAKALGPQVQIQRIEEGSPDAVYLQSIEEMCQRYPTKLTGMWFAEGLAAERQVDAAAAEQAAAAPDDDPPDARPDDDAQPEPDERVDEAVLLLNASGGTRWAALIFTVLVVLLGLSFVRTDSILAWVDARIASVAEMVQGSSPPPALIRGGPPPGSERH